MFRESIQFSIHFKKKRQYMLTISIQAQIKIRQMCLVPLVTGLVSIQKLKIAAPTRYLIRGVSGTKIKNYRKTPLFLPALNLKIF
jgi:hypothetical protein